MIFFSDFFFWKWLYRKKVDSSRWRMAVFAAFFRFLDTFDQLKADAFASHSIYENDNGFFISIPCSNVAAGPFANREGAFQHLWIIIQRCRNSLINEVADRDEPAAKRQRRAIDPTVKSVAYERATVPAGKGFYANVSHPFKVVTDNRGIPLWVRMKGVNNSQGGVFAAFAHEDGTRFLVHDNCHDAVTLARQLTIRYCQQRMKQNGELKRVEQRRSIKLDDRCSGCRKRLRDCDRFCAECGKQRCSLALS